MCKMLAKIFAKIGFFFHKAGVDAYLRSLEKEFFLSFIYQFSNFLSVM
jgi:hypothetical protein